VTLRTSACVDSACPHSFPPASTLTTPGGNTPPISSAILSADKGACSGALTTIVLPAASGAPIFTAANISGWLYATIRATTPSGSRSV
jgi:hypothetical protein